ncbi:MAG TPA: PAS domain-containing sensor histidine kinase [Albidovulum sp.]|uniref:sensor histidine kinase NtrY-like n=1 Tax=Albidovulum sp. TaxID=1872424 RepID=UPI001DECE4A0|nr:PAS domain-containing sensor histidine kinase [Paracoccaceae bacterium]HPE24555.1 PAS domain-containing sensor histidine kinase [Albidovulum sp.]MCB2140781.1 PAS domain-containing sensor histidine kinase [Paracoccaceae bacterium]MCO5126871.1 PAS domain-containing sensor histidine kinase [Paracoccaceae bacterium]MCP5323946.1 PAS domain-containing sensor histidine kinase [Paracoccaceae bacterium]
MQGFARSAPWERLSRLRRQRRVQNIAALGLVILGPLLAFATFVALGPMGQGANSTGLRLILLADFVYFLLLATLILSRLAQVIASRRAQSAGSRLHLRLTGVFAGIALVPTIIVAIFAGLTVNIGLEGWFSERVRSVVGTSLSAAEAYQEEHRQDLVTDAEALSRFLEAAREKAFLQSDAELRQALNQAQGQIQRGLREAYVIDGGGAIRARGERSYLFDYEEPSAEDFTDAEAGDPVLIEDWQNNEFRALVKLAGFADRYLYISRAVDGDLLSLLDDTRETVGLYQQLESTRGRVLFEFGLVYLGFALILVLAAIWMGLWFAERLSRPVGRLAGAAQRVGAGDLDVQVTEEEGDDEIAMLGRIFNQMTRQLKGQREALVDSHRQTERRRRLFDSVLSSVTSGVVGLDAEGQVDFLNRAAVRLLEMDEERHHDRPLNEAVPEFSALFDRLREGLGEVAQEEIKVSRGGRLESLLVRMATRRNAEGRLEGYVVAFDDVTDLVSAQRMAAWGDVARRIAHEIKNPLTPIQLSAERIRRKFSRMVEGEDAEALIQMTDVIIRQTGDLRRIVDEFSKFARMPEPDRRDHDLAKLMRDAVTLQEGALHGARLVADVPRDPIVVELDATMISQAVTNLIKNAGEAVESLVEKGAPDGYAPEVRVTMSATPETVTICIADNGVGLPADRARLFEPYVTTREKGTGLGLPIVKKIIEEHGGTLILTDAPVFDGGAHHGALAEIRLPRARAAGRSVKERAAETAVSGP